MSSPSSQPQGWGRILLLVGEGQSSREEPTDRLLPGHLILIQKEQRAEPHPSPLSLNVRQAVGRVPSKPRH